MKGWIEDFGRLVWSLFYWNTRKTIYRWRRGRGHCPCQNPSDSGEPLRTGCDAAVAWNRPARFRRVCPLLRQNETGYWVCSVRAAEVRPFWGRVLAYVAGSTGTVVLVGVLGVFTLMRVIGYEVTLRQIVWPPAWSELSEVRSRLFITQAREHYAKGEVREALSALSVAYSLDQQNYHVAMMLAQFYQAGNPTLADDMYARLLREMPEHRVETARVWFRSLLARGRLADVAEVARRQLEAEPGQAAAWTHALVFAARHMKQPELLAKAATDKDVSQAAQATLALAAEVLALPREQAKGLLLLTPPAANFPYDRVYRIETLIELGYPDDALQLLRQFRGQLAGRDVARLAFAVYAALGDTERLVREFDALLAPNRNLTAGELSVLAVHLINNPNETLLAKVTDALSRVPLQPVEQRLEVCLAVFCAAGVQADAARMTAVKEQISDTLPMNLGGLNKLERFFLLKRQGEYRIGALLLQQNSMSLELNYALLDKYLKDVQPPPSRR